MEQLIQIASLIALITFIILTFFLISAVSSLKFTMKVVEQNVKGLMGDLGKLTNKANSSIDEIISLKPKIEKAMDDISDMKEKSIETMAKTDDLAMELTSLTKNINTTVGEITDSIGPYKTMVDTFYNKVSPPVNQTAHFVSGVYKFMSAFVSKLS